jgi:hypothetical protein
MGISGRGLQVIADVSDRHGATEKQDGKVMWAEFDCP